MKNIAKSILTVILLAGVSVSCINEAAILDKISGL